MRFHYIMPVKHIQFIESKGKLINNVKFFGPGHKEIKNLYDNKKFIEALGKKSVDELSKETILVVESSTEHFEQKYGQNYQSEMSQAVMNTVKNAVNSLWLVCDNSALTPVGYFISQDKNTIYCDRSDQFYTNANGEYELKSFGKNQLDYGLPKAEKLIQIAEKRDNASKPRPDSAICESIGSALNRYGFKYNRIKRAKTLLGHARRESYLPMKISMYVAALECLFSGSSGEIKFKLTQRVVLFVGGDVKTKTNNKNLIRRGYDIRSNYLHGNRFSEGANNSLASLQETARKMDEILRNVFLKVIDNPDVFLVESEFENKLTEYFDKLLFGES